MTDLTAEDRAVIAEIVAGWVGAAEDELVAVVEQLRPQANRGGLPHADRLRLAAAEEALCVPRPAAPEAASEPAPARPKPRTR